jgi:predicted metal-dependent peptidase
MGHDFTSYKQRYLEERLQWFETREELGEKLKRIKIAIDVADATDTSVETLIAEINRILEDEDDAPRPR